MRFDAHGKSWRLKRVGMNDFALWQMHQTATRVRFGNRAEIGEDIAAVELTGMLPGQQGRP